MSEENPYRDPPQRYRTAPVPMKGAWMGADVSSIIQKLGANERIVSVYPITMPTAGSTYPLLEVLIECAP